MIREQRFYDTSDFGPERLAAVGEHYVAAEPEDPDHRGLAGDDVREDADGWDIEGFYGVGTEFLGSDD